MNENNIPHIVDQGASVPKEQDERWERLAKIEKTPIEPEKKKIEEDNK